MPRSVSSRSSSTLYRPYVTPPGAYRVAARTAYEAGRYLGNQLRRWSQSTSQSAQSSNKSSSSNTERPANDDTRLNTNSTFNATSLFVRKGKRRVSKRKKVAFKKRKAFKKKVSKALTAYRTWNSAMFIATDTMISSYSTVTASLSKQHIHPVNQYTSPVAMLMAGCPPNVSTTRGLGETFNHILGIGWVEDGAAQNPATQPFDKCTLQFRERLDITIKCLDSEATTENKHMVDIYEFVAARNIENTSEGLLYDTPYQAWDTCLTATRQSFPLGGSVGAQIPQDKGLRPGDCPEFKKWWTITKVTRVQFTSKEEFLYQIHTSGQMNFGKSKTQRAIKGVTKTFMLIVDGVGITGNGTELVSDFEFHTTKKIDFRRIDNNSNSIIPAKPEARWGYTELITMT